MCACRHRKSFLIEDILKEPKKPHRISSELKQPLCRAKTDNCIDERDASYKITADVQRELESKVNVSLEQRKNTYPIYPRPVKAGYYTPIRLKRNYPLESRHPFSYYSDPVMNSEQFLQSQIAASRFIAHPYGIRQTYGIDGVPTTCCSPWWGVGGRRKGGQVRFSAVQTGALERRFNASKYLSPDERRALAASLRLSDRQVKTWFQNRRAKWRRSTPEAADEGSPPSADEQSDDELTVADED